MERIVLVACSSKMQPYSAPARDLYVGQLFKLSLSFAEQLEPSAIFILSAQHGLVGLGEVIGEDLRTINTMPAKELKRWAERVRSQLSQVASLSNDHFILLAGRQYWRYLVPYLGSYSVPLDGLRTGERIEFLKWMTSIKDGIDTRHYGFYEYYGGNY